MSDRRQLKQCHKCGEPIELKPIEGIPDCYWGGMDMNGRHYHDECWSEAELLNYASEKGLLRFSD